ncbi:calpain-5-like [Saccostrea cucullata]|uniref:calpain-5-like n=1 Tax=Saccostrea cuccullata TaxID=36930 RepID=UPI002ED38038
MGLKFVQEGELWMSFPDFMNTFTHIDICHFVNTSIISIKRPGVRPCFTGSGPSQAEMAGMTITHYLSQQSPEIYVFDIGGAQDRVMVSLEQHDIKPGRQELGIQLNNIGFHIMKVEENRKFRVHIVGEKVFTSEYAKSRSVFGIMILQKGRYVIVPTTTSSDELGPFMLRLYTGSSSGAKELTMECPSNGCPCAANYVLVSTVTIESCSDLEIPPKSKVKTMDPYVKIICEGEKVESLTRSNDKNPKFGTKATFYRKKPDDPIIVEVLY